MKMMRYILSEPTDMQAKRSGFSLIELLTVVGVIGLIVSLSLPAIQTSREAARRTNCLNNMKQIGVAMNNYALTWNVFPPNPLDNNSLGFSRVFSAFALILPDLDQSNLFNSINFSTSIGGDLNQIAPNTTSMGTFLYAFVCPSDYLVDPSQPAPINYRTNNGVCGDCKAGTKNGAFTIDGTSTAGFLDGLSNTLLISEKLIGTNEKISFEPNRDWIRCNPPNPEHYRQDTVEDWLRHCSSRTYSLDSRNIYHNAGRGWIHGNVCESGFFVSAPPNSRIPDCGYGWIDGLGVFTARSLHPGGVDAAMADGSVRFFTNGINANVWRALGTRNGMEAVTFDSP